MPLGKRFNVVAIFDHGMWIERCDRRINQVLYRFMCTPDGIMSLRYDDESDTWTNNHYIKGRA